MPTKLWEPPEALVEGALMTRYMRWLDKGFTSYEELHRFSVEDLEGFWASIWDFFELEGGYDAVLGDRSMPGAEWFPGARVNYAEHAFRGKPDDQLAIQHASESRELASWTWADLRRETARVRAGLVALGVGEGDRVAAFLPNIA